MNVEEHMKLPYHITMVRNESGDGDGAWVVWVEELPGCISQGDSAADATAMIDDAMRGWFQVAIDHGDPIPEPRPESTYKGKMMVRLPAGLHACLDAGARREGVSLNQFIATVLAGALGWTPAGRRSPSPAGEPGEEKSAAKGKEPNSRRSVRNRRAPVIATQE